MNLRHPGGTVFQGVLLLRDKSARAISSMTLRKWLTLNLIITYQFLSKTLLLVSGFFSVGAAETEIARVPRIRPIDVIKIVPTAVLHVNIDGPSATIWTPAETHLSCQLTLVFPVVSAIQPSCSVRPASVRSGTRSGHFCSRTSLETKPCRPKSFVAKVSPSVVCYLSVGIAQYLVVLTF